MVLAALVEEGLTDRAGVESARRSAAEQRTGACEALVQRGTVSARDVALVRASICECPYVDVERYQVDIRNAALMSRTLAESMRAFVLFVCGETATVGMANPLDLRALDQVRAVVKMDVEPVLCEPESLSRLIERAYSLGGGRGKEAAAESAVLTTGREPAVAAVNQILTQAMEKGASDVHIGPDEQALHLRYRIDGSLTAQQGPGLNAHAAIVQRLKVMAGLDLTQTRRPQDGKFRFATAGRTVDIRISFIPTVTGENVVMRLLSSAGAIRGFAELGLQNDDAARVERSLESSNGMVLVTGPTGSGKTTTLYTALKKLNTPDVNIITVEDPVEVRMPMVRQVQANAEIGMTFAGALRSILRQDPDIVLVGEIRDDETARIAVQAALTGHLLLSSLHTNDASGAIPRLRDLGVPGFAINASLQCVIGQRLARRVCPDCARPETPRADVLARFGSGASDGAYVRGQGCGRCGSTGYRGRVGLYEVLTATPGVQRVVEADGSAAAVLAAARRDGMRLMWEDGLQKARVGQTTLEEVARTATVAAGDESEQVSEHARGVRKAA